MKLVIEIPDDEYQRWTTEGEMDAFIARNAMVNGTPLPKVIEAIKKDIKKEALEWRNCGNYIRENELYNAIEIIDRYMGKEKE